MKKLLSLILVCGLLVSFSVLSGAPGTDGDSVRTQELPTIY